MQDNKAVFTGDGGIATAKNKITLYLGRALFRDIKDIAAVDDRSASYLIRKVMKKFIDEHKNSETEGSLARTSVKCIRMAGFSTKRMRGVWTDEKQNKSRG